MSSLWTQISDWMDDLPPPLDESQLELLRRLYQVLIESLLISYPTYLLGCLSKCWLVFLGWYAKHAGQASAELPSVDEDVWREVLEKWGNWRVTHLDEAWCKWGDHDCDAFVTHKINNYVARASFVLSFAECIEYLPDLDAGWLLELVNRAYVFLSVVNIAFPDSWAKHLEETPEDVQSLRKMEERWGKPLAGSLGELVYQEYEWIFNRQSCSSDDLKQEREKSAEMCSGLESQCDSPDLAFFEMACERFSSYQGKRTPAMQRDIKYLKSELLFAINHRRLGFDERYEQCLFQDYPLEGAQPFLQPQEVVQINGNIYIVSCDDCSEAIGDHGC